MAFTFNLNTLPKTETEHLHRFIKAENHLDRKEAADQLFEQIRPMVQYICEHLLWPRFRHLAPEIIQEAWESCLREFLARREDFLCDERPQFRQFALGVTVRTVRRLQKREQRQQARMLPWESVPGSDRWAYEDDLDRLDFQRICERVWKEVLESSTPDVRLTLETEGPVSFFAGDWGSDATELCARPQTITSIVLERRRRARSILNRILKYVHRVDAKSRTGLVDEVLPLPRSARRGA